jgi:hypothetical protein
MSSGNMPAVENDALVGAFTARRREPERVADDVVSGPGDVCAGIGIPPLTGTSIFVFSPVSVSTTVRFRVELGVVLHAGLRQA